MEEATRARDVQKQRMERQRQEQAEERERRLSEMQAEREHAGQMLMFKEQARVDEERRQRHEAEQRAAREATSRAQRKLERAMDIHLDMHAHAHAKFYEFERSVWEHDHEEYQQRFPGVHAVGSVYGDQLHAEESAGVNSKGGLSAREIVELREADKKREQEEFRQKEKEKAEREEVEREKLREALRMQREMGENERRATDSVHGADRVARIQKEVEREREREMEVFKQKELEKSLEEERQLQLEIQRVQQKSTQRTEVGGKYKFDEGLHDAVQKTGIDVKHAFTHGRETNRDGESGKIPKVRSDHDHHGSFVFQEDEYSGTEAGGGSAGPDTYEEGHAQASPSNQGRGATGDAEGAFVREDETDKHSNAEADGSHTSTCREEREVLVGKHVQAYVGMRVRKSAEVSVHECACAYPLVRTRVCIPMYAYVYLSAFMGIHMHNGADTHIHKDTRA
jgi:hypothetical protein